MAIAKNLPSSKSWEEGKSSLMYDLMREKYLQCPEYREALRSDTVFVEDTAHPFWGRGKAGNGKNVLGEIHGEILRNGKSILIVGSSHVRGLASLLQQAMSSLSTLVAVEEKCFPGGTTETIHRWVGDNASMLGSYDYVFVLVGGNNFYTKQGMFRMDAKKVCSLLTDLYRDIMQLAPNSRLVTTEILPRCLPRSQGSDGDLMRNYNRQAARTNSGINFDVHLPELWGSGCFGNTYLFRRDRVHLNDLGKVILATK